MIKRLFYLSFFSQFLINYASAQAVDNFSSTRNINNDHYFRFHYENDYFTATDRYYTQGVLFEYVHPSLNKFPLTHLLLFKKNNLNKAGVSLELDGYTPTSIRHNEILYGDHPYAGTLFIKTFMISADSSKQTRLSSCLVTGVIGPLAAGEEIQTSIHHWLGNFEPLGWQNQIQNDVLLNYEIGYEKKLLSAGRYFLLNGFGTARAGTLSDKLGVGLIIMTGYFNPPFPISANEIKKFSAHVYMQPFISFVGYDATMQGGIFNHNIPYKISADEIERITFQNNAGIILNINKLYLEYFQSYISKVFNTGTFHRWGGIRIGVAF